MLRICTTSGTFIIYAAICVVAIWFVYACVPETMGRTLEELEDTVTDGCAATCAANVAPTPEELSSQIPKGETLASAAETVA